MQRDDPTRDSETDRSARFRGRLPRGGALRRFVPLVLVFLLSGFAAVPSLAQDKVVLQLRWDHQAQFAGDYAAQWLGYYAAAGIEVEIRSAFTPDGLVQAIPEVLDGRADFGIGAADVLVAIDGGANLMIASPVFQQSGFGLISRADSRISSPADLVGLRIAVPASAVSQAELNAMLVAEGIDANGIHWVETRPGETDRLIANGEIDAFFSFRSSAGRWRLSQGGVATNFLNPSTYGVDFYGDSIFTSSRLADENPGLVQRFVEASIAGWQYAATHDHEIADRIAAELERTVAVSNLHLQPVHVSGR